MERHRDGKLEAVELGRPDFLAIISSAALAAMECDEELQANLDVYKANRTLMIDGLKQAGFTNFAPPDGAFYVYADVSDLTDDSRAFAFGKS